MMRIMLYTYWTPLPDYVSSRTIQLHLVRGQSTEIGELQS